MSEITEKRPSVTDPQQHVDHVPILKRFRVQRASHSSDKKNKDQEIKQSIDRPGQSMIVEETKSLERFYSLFIEYACNEDAISLIVPTPFSTDISNDWIKFPRSVGSPMGVERTILFTFPPDVTHQSFVELSKRPGSMLDEIKHSINQSNIDMPEEAHAAFNQASDLEFTFTSKLMKAGSQLPVDQSINQKRVSDFLKKKCFLTLSINQVALVSIKLVHSHDVEDADRAKFIANFATVKLAIGKVPKYPHDGLALLAATLQGKLAWFRKYVSHNFGSRLINRDFRVPFKTWTNTPSQQNNQSSISQSASLPGVFPLVGDADGEVRISLAADWAAATLESELVAMAMVGDCTTGQEGAKNGSTDQTNSDSNFVSCYQAHLTLHAGDIYYFGEPAEVEQSCLGKHNPARSQKGVEWPSGSRGRLMIPGNHEYYSGGKGFFNTLLPHMWIKDRTQTTTQQASYFALEHPNWLIIALDTGYDSFQSRPFQLFPPKILFDNDNIDLPPQLREWLTQLLARPENKTKGLVFISHHQVTSAWKKESHHTLFQQRVADLIADRSRTVIWLYGHEHRFAAYDKQTSVQCGKQTINLSVYHRCIGNSGFPCEVLILPTASRSTGLQYFDDRHYQVKLDNSISLPLGFNGFTRCTLNTQNQFVLEYFTLRMLETGELTSEKPTRLMKEVFSQSNGSVQLEVQCNVDPQLTQVRHVK